MMNILLANLIILPAGVLCSLPVKANLKHSFPKTIAIMLPALFCADRFVIVFDMAVLSQRK